MTQQEQYENMKIVTRCKDCQYYISFKDAQGYGLTALSEMLTIARMLRRKIRRINNPHYEVMKNERKI